MYMYASNALFIAFFSRRVEGFFFTHKLPHFPEISVIYGKLTFPQPLPSIRLPIVAPLLV